MTAQVTIPSNLPIGIEHECDMSHSSIRELFLELVTRVLETLATRLQVVDRDAEMPEAAARVGITVGDFKFGVILGAVVVGELNDSLSIGDMRIG